MAKPRKEQKTELRPDAWERFGLAVDAAIKSGPKHRRSVVSKPHEESKFGKPKPKRPRFSAKAAPKEGKSR